MAATEKGVWGLQDVRDKQLQDEWEYNGDPFENGGQLWALGGDNTYGGLGLNNTNPESSPKQVGTDTNWQLNRHSLAISQITAIGLQQTLTPSQL